MFKYWMISLRNQGGSGDDRNAAGPMYFVSDNDNIDQISNWQRVPFQQFQKALVDACASFPDLPPERHEEEKHLLLGIHGYNTPWGPSISFYKTLLDRLFTGPESLGICILLTWPSKGEVFDYLPDREEARKCADDLGDILTKLYQVLAKNQLLAASKPGKACKAKTSIIAHSMGNFLAQLGMFHLWRRINSPLGLSVINQLLMVAADVDNDLFGSGEQLGDGDGEGIANLTYRVTAFYSGLDPVLGASAGLKHFLKRRLGRSGLDRTAGNGRPAAPDNVWDTDCTEFFGGVPTQDTHGAYFNDIPKVTNLMRQVLRGVDRGVLVNNGTASPSSWWPNKLP